MRYRLKIESNLNEVQDFISDETFSLDEAVKKAELYKQRVWLLNSAGTVIAQWNGLGGWK